MKVSPSVVISDRRTDCDSRFGSFSVKSVANASLYLTLTRRQSYFAAISYVDDQFGRLMSGISTIDPSFFEDVVVVVTSDHGWSLGEHGEWSKYSNFDVATRVPLMVYDSPSIERRRINESAVGGYNDMCPVCPFV